ncbi:MAG TPA: hypothetical protein V6D30_17065 [Leptolyngbyaceae cyanobacterium]
MNFEFWILDFLLFASSTYIRTMYSSGSYQIRSYNPLFVFGRRDVPVERLYKDMQLAEKGGIKPGFRISHCRYCLALLILGLNLLLGKKLHEC